jgi:hypothetical protein
MTQEEKKIKPVPGLKETVGKEIVGNAIVMVIIVLCSWGLAFHTWGPPNGIGTYLGFIACMIPFFTIIQAYVPFINKRADLAHGKWELKEDEARLPAEPLTNVWSLILPRALVYGFGSMLIVVTLIKVLHWEPSTLWVVILVLVIQVATTTLLIKEYLPRHLLSFAAAVKEGKKAAPQPLAGYFIVEHFVPFFMLQAFINGCVANRAFHFELAKGGQTYVPGPALVPDVFITFVLLALIHWMFSNALTRGDVRLGRVPADKLKNLSGWAALGIIFGAALISAVVYGFILKIGGVPGLSVGMAVIFKMTVIALSIILGSWIGIRWGGSREYAEMKQG